MRLHLRQLGGLVKEQHPCDPRVRVHLPRHQLALAGAQVVSRRRDGHSHLDFHVTQQRELVGRPGAQPFEQRLIRKVAGRLVDAHPPEAVRKEDRQPENRRTGN